jgi:hypothetical protein
MGEGIGKVVYASEHWVVKRERTPFEIVALIVVWRVERLLPKSLRGRIIDRPSRQLRFFRVVVQATLAVLPKAVWCRRQDFLGYVALQRRVACPVDLHPCRRGRAGTEFVTY